MPGESHRLHMHLAQIKNHAVGQLGKVLVWVSLHKAASGQFLIAIPQIALQVALAVSQTALAAIKCLVGAIEIDLAKLRCAGGVVDMPMGQQDSEGQAGQIFYKSPQMSYSQARINQDGPLSANDEVEVFFAGTFDPKNMDGNWLGTIIHSVSPY